MNAASKDQGGNQPPELLIRAIRRILTPFVKILISYGVTFPMLSEMLKRIYVKTAAKHFSLNNKKRLSDSRISLITRVHRKDVRRIRNEDAHDVMPLASASLGAQIVAEWAGNPSYTDEKGEPLVLQRGETSAGGPSFDKLVSSISTDMRPRVVLDELVRLGVVELLPGDHIRLNRAAFVPKSDFNELLPHFERNLHDHIAAAGSNLTGAGSFLERSVYYADLSSDSVQALTKLAEDKGMEAVLAVNKSARARSKKDATREDATQRITFGVYFYAETEDDGS